MPISQVPFAGISNPVNFRNRIINGDMTISQRNGTSSVTAVNNAYCLDRFQIYSGAASKFSVQQVSDAPSGFAFSLKTTSSSAYSVGASESFNINQFIEGFNTVDLAFGTASAKTVTLSFWVKSSLTGTFGGALNNASYGRSYPFTYTISSANTWEYKTKTVAGDTSGTWIGATNGIGLIVSFGIGNGSSVSGTANSWASALYTNATGATSVVGTNGATWQITGVQLEAGDQASGFEFLPIDVNLARCYRYFEIIYLDEFVSCGQAHTTSAVKGDLNYLTQKRAIPTITLPTVGTASGNVNFLASDVNYPATTGTITIPDATVSRFVLAGSGFTSSFTAGNASYFYSSSTSQIKVDAEL